MQNWINFFNFLFWITLIMFVSNINNLIKLIFYSELVWIILYCITIIQGSINDDLTLLSTSIFILGLAGLEYAIGIILLLIFKNINKTLSLEEFENNSFNFKYYNNNNTYINRYIWNYNK